jgi:hypothetical protein
MTFIVFFRTIFALSRNAGSYAVPIETVSFGSVQAVEQLPVSIRQPKNGWPVSGTR